MDELKAKLAEAKARLLERRVQRIAPHRDEKVLVDWNGMMLASLAEAALVFGRDDYLEAAIANATFITEQLFDGKDLKHVYKDGQSKIDGYLLDYATLCEGLIRLYQATFDDKWLNITKTIADSMIKHFWNESKQCFYDVAEGNNGLIVRPREVFDNAIPSGSAAATYVLVHLSRLMGNADYEKIAKINLVSVQDFLSKYPSGFGHWLCAQDCYLSKVQEIAIVGNFDEETTKSLVGVVNSKYLPNKVFDGKLFNGTARRSEVPFLKDKGLFEGRPAVYICEDFTCREPVTDPEKLAGLIGHH